ncbi:TolC family protein [Pendulispora albinea]|uniref:TolC family protein n=1 Tax=Pendulispora albinea TaxID=2741071 RepID=A0ABZ2LPB3_9BACT
MGRFRTRFLAAFLGLSALAPLANAGPSDAANESVVKVAAPSQAAKQRTYTLAECLALADRNHPNLWAARAKVAGYHALLDEARWTPFSQWSIDASLSSIADLRGAAPYSDATADDVNTTFKDGFNPWFRMGLRGAIPLYTFGKIESIARAARGQIRYGEWDSEKARQETRMAVRKAFYSVMAARDTREHLIDVLGKVDKSLDSINAKRAKGDPSVEPEDGLRIEFYRDQLRLRASEPDVPEASNMAALRFMTGVATNFDIPNEHLARPDTTLGPIVSYLSAARLFRPEINQARAGIVGRVGQLDFARAKLFPDVGIGVGTGFTVAPSAITQNGWAPNPYNSNGIGPGFAMAARWSMDFLPAQARIEAAESALEEVRSLLRFALGGVAVEVEQTYAAAAEAQQREARWQHAEEVTRKWLTKVQDGVDLGATDRRFIMDPLRMYLDARLSHIIALKEYNIALADLARASGWDRTAPSK